MLPYTGVCTVRRMLYYTPFRLTKSFSAATTFLPWSASEPWCAFEGPLFVRSTGVSPELKGRQEPSRMMFKYINLPIRGPCKTKSTLSTPLYPTSHSIQKSRVGSFDASRRVALGLSWAKHLGNYFLNYGRYCEQQQQQQRQLEACSRFKFDRHQTAIGWIVSPRSPLVDGTCS